MAGEMTWDPSAGRPANALFYISLAAGHTPSGNPKRVYVVFSDEFEVMDAIDEGYQGRAAVENKYPGIRGGTRFATTTGEYRELLKWANERS